MILNIINPILLFFQTLLFTLRYLSILFGMGYMIYWFVWFVASPEKKETTFKNDLYKKFSYRCTFGSFFISFGFALYIQQEIIEYIHLTFPLISISMPIMIISGFALQAIKYETYKRSNGGKR